MRERESLHACVHTAVGTEGWREKKAGSVFQRERVSHKQTVQGRDCSAH